nr:deoxyguanosinetriphosphate triphosphohydrolase [Planctomycetota bacterium]
GLGSVAAVRAAAPGVVGMAPSMVQAKEGLEAWLFANLYRHHLVNRVFHKARRILGDLFVFYTAHPDSLPPEHGRRAEGLGLHRAVADYIAGMTDRFAMEEHRELFGHGVG